jgi:hypothetical protein
MTRASGAAAGEEREKGAQRRGKAGARLLGSLSRSGASGDAVGAGRCGMEQGTGRSGTLRGGAEQRAEGSGSFGSRREKEEGEN